MTSEAFVIYDIDNKVFVHENDLPGHTARESIGLFEATVYETNQRAIWAIEYLANGQMETVGILRTHTDFRFGTLEVLNLSMVTSKVEF